MSDERRFSAMISKEGTRGFVPLPFDPVEAWGARARYDLCGTIQGCVWRGKVGSFGDRFGLPCGPTWLSDVGLAVGQAVEVVVRLEGPQPDQLAEDIRSAFAGAPAAKAAFEGMPSFHRKNYMRWVDEAKRPETRAKRIQEMMRMLEEKRRM